jgi:hypothetical protein
MVMGTHYGQKSSKISSTDINQIIYANGTIINQGDDANGNFYIKFQFDTYGCGGPDGYIRVELKNTIPWTKISYEIYNAGSAACWSYNQGAFDGNLLSFDLSLDRIFNSTNSFALPQYTKKMAACDNSPDNFLHVVYQTGTISSFFVTRRKNTSNSSLSQITHQRSCNSVGAGSYVIIRNIVVF